MSRQHLPNFQVVSPERTLRKQLKLMQDEASKVFRSMDGSGSNMETPEYGKANTPFLRLAGYHYADGISEPVVRSSYTPREISNLIVKQNVSEPNNFGLNFIHVVYGQLCDHLLTLTQEGDEELNMITPPDDEYPNLTIPFKRSKAVINRSPREQINTMSSFIDAANVYGNDSNRTYYLRRLDGSGKLKTSLADNGEEILPYNLDNLPNAMSTSSSFFIAGDLRANEHAYLTALHVLFVREHNRLCDRFSYLGDEEKIFQHARRYITGLFQHITFNEFLPALLGEKMPEYSGYKPLINPNIANEFATVLYRIGHTMVPSVLKNYGKADVNLRDIFFNPAFVKSNGIDSLLKGACETLQEEINEHVVEDLRSFLFHSPDTTLLDLSVLNQVRNSEHGISSYNQLRQAYGLPSKTINQITDNQELRDKLTLIYGTADNIDPWIGALCESKYQNKPLGELLYTGIKEQFLRIRDGDRFWFENDIQMKHYISEIKNTLLSDVINRNCSLQVQKDVFHV